MLDIAQNTKSMGTLATLFLFTTLRAGACALVYPTVEVSQNFRVRVLDRDRSVKGLKVTLGSVTDALSTSSPVVNQSMTGSDGYADFVDVAPGAYFVSADHDGGIVDGAEIRVRRDGTAGVTVKLKWPSTTPLQVRSAEGMLRLPDFDPRHPTQKQLSLTLIEALSNSVIGTAEADSGGRFSFPTPQPGLYFVRLNSSEVKSWSGDEISGDITIYVTPDAKSNGLSLDLGWSTCGLYYSDLSQCSQPELTVAQVCGDVFDPSGAVISKAQILLLKGEENPVAVAETSSDAKGHFFLPSPAVGTYELYVKGPSGFRGAHSTIHLSATNPAEYCVKPIPIQLGVFGSCSSIGLEEKQ